MFARLREIARRYGIEAAALKWNALMGHAEGDAVSFASCVCAAAFDANRNHPERAEAICAEVWTDEALSIERYFRERRDAALEIFDEYKCGPFVALGVRNRYASVQNDVEVDLQCCRCGRRKIGRARSLASVYSMKCPACGAEN